MIGDKTIFEKRIKWGDTGFYYFIFEFNSYDSVQSHRTNFKFESMEDQFNRKMKRTDRKQNATNNRKAHCYESLVVWFVRHRSSDCGAMQNQSAANNCRWWTKIFSGYRLRASCIDHCFLVWGLLRWNWLRWWISYLFCMRLRYK